jgi:hypothetical protein
LCSRWSARPSSSCRSGSDCSSRRAHYCSEHTVCSSSSSGSAWLIMHSSAGHSVAQAQGVEQCWG